MVAVPVWAIEPCPDAALRGTRLRGRGGRVIDPASKLDAIRDIAIADGKIVAVKANIDAGGAGTLDASGKLVVPGLIDIHTHAARAKEAARPNSEASRSRAGMWNDRAARGPNRVLAPAQRRPRADADDRPPSRTAGSVPVAR